MFENVTSVAIEGARFRYWDRIRIERAIDNIDTVELSAPFDSNDKAQREVFKPLSYSSFGVSINDDPLFTGTMVTCVPQLNPEENTVTLGAYSLPGVLGDCPPPASDLPSEYRKQNLLQIAESAVRSFGITVYLRGDPGPVFDKVSREPGTNVLPFLAELAQQRNFVIGSTPAGALMIWRAIDAGDPVAFLEQGQSPMTSIVPTFDPSKYFSEITGLRPVRVRAKKSVQFTVRNTLLPGVFRPHIFEVDDAKDGDLETAVRGKVGRMYANMVSYEIAVATWRDRKGNLWEPNTIIRVKAPGVFLYRPYDFVIRSIVFRRAAKTETATLNIMLPGSFTGVEPGGLPWVE